MRFRSWCSCPRCGQVVPEGARGRLWCGGCRLWFTVTTGTLLERSKVPLRTWLVVA